MSKVSNLYRLQEIDTQIDSARIRIEEIKAQLADNEVLQKAEAALDECKEYTREAAHVNSSAEHAVETQRQKISSTETKMYSGDVTNPKELEDLQAESESLKRHLETLEDQMLETMVALEEATEHEEESSVSFLSIAAQNEDESAELIQEREELTKRLATLEEERAAAAASVPDSDMAKYQELRENYRGRAIADVSDGSCNACGLEHTASVQQKARLGEEFVYCDQCKRILYSG